MRFDPGQCFLKFCQKFFCLFTIFECCFDFFGFHPCNCGFRITKYTFIFVWRLRAWCMRIMFFFKLFYISKCLIDSQKFSYIICSHWVYGRMKHLFSCFEIHCSIFHYSWISRTCCIDTKCVGNRYLCFHTKWSNDKIIKRLYDVLRLFCWLNRFYLADIGTILFYQKKATAIRYFFIIYFYV